MNILSKVTDEMQETLSQSSINFLSAAFFKEKTLRHKETQGRLKVEKFEYRVQP